MITSAVMLAVKLVGIGTIGTIASGAMSVFHQASPFKPSKKGGNNIEIETLRQRAKELG